MPEKLLVKTEEVIDSISLCLQPLNERKKEMSPHFAVWQKHWLRLKFDLNVFLHLKNANDGMSNKKP